MSAVLTSTRRLTTGQKAVLVRDGVAFKGSVFRVAATPAGDDAYWMLRGANGQCALAVREVDDLYTSSPAPCFACAPPGFVERTPTCAVCFDRFL